ncbi:MAG: hypothetical protein RR998_08275 [Oscillospiraceae bacterium]
MNRYKKVITASMMGILFILISVCFLGTSRLYFQKDKTMDISNVSYNHSEYNSEEITNRVDLANLESLLMSIRCRKYRTSFAPYLAG